LRLFVGVRAAHLANSNERVHRLAQLGELLDKRQRFHCLQPGQLEVTLCIPQKKKKKKVQR
jgi:hypothetical protein